MRIGNLIFPTGEIPYRGGSLAERERKIAKLLVELLYEPSSASSSSSDEDTEGCDNGIRAGC